jgi:hypothetical protein
MFKIKINPMRVAFIASLAIGLAGFVLFSQKAIAGNLTTGPLTISYDGTGPIFSALNLAPGATFNKEITVANNGTVPHSFALATRNVSGALSDKIYIEPIGGEPWKMSIKELSEIPEVSKIILANIAPGQSVAIILKATFDSGANNNYQNQSVSFDLIFGAEEAEPVISPLISSGLTASIGGGVGGPRGGLARFATGGITSPTETPATPPETTPPPDSEPEVKGTTSESTDHDGFKWELLLIVPVVSVVAIVALPVSIEAALLVPTVAGATTAVLAPEYSGALQPWVFWLILVVEVIAFLVIKYYRYFRKAARGVVKEVKEIEQELEEDLKKLGGKKKK